MKVFENLFKLLLEQENNLLSLKNHNFRHILAKEAAQIQKSEENQFETYI